MFTIIISIISFLFPSAYVFCYRGIWSTKSAYERPCDPRPFLLTQHLGIATTAHWDSIWPLIFDLSCHYCLYVMAPFWMYIWVSSHQNPLFPRTDNKICQPLLSMIASHLWTSNFDLTCHYMWGLPFGCTFECPLINNPSSENQQREITTIALHDPTFELWPDIC